MICKLGNIIIAKANKAKEPCPAIELSACKYGDIQECVFNKSKCHHLEYKKNKGKSDKTRWKVLSFILAGVLLYCISVLVSTSYKNTNCVWIINICNIVSGISISIIAGALLTYIIDIPSKLKEYETSFLNALSSNSYLRNLDEDRLIQLRKDITEQLHVKNAPYMAKGLIDIDQRICDLLKQPYFTKYRHSVICSDIEGNEKFITKEHMIDYKLKNPYGRNKDGIENIHISNLILKEENEEPKNYISDLRIEYRIDGSELSVSVSDSLISIEANELNNKVEFYNTRLRLCSTSRDGTLKDGITVNFKKELDVRIQYKIKVPKDDICFSKRLRHPAKNFRLDYAHNNSRIKLYGQLFGTEIKQSDINIKYINDNTISIETFDWLLPDNGAIIVATNKN